MYIMPRKLWIIGYIATWAMVMAVFFTDRPMWECVLASVLALSFVGFTDPAPRRIATVRAGCDCARCVSMRARHARRSTDTKDAG